MTGYITNLHPDLTALLTRLESHMGFPLQITSGYRDPVHNIDVGGVTNSEHTHDPSLAADVLCHRSTTRFTMLKWLLAEGVTRIGIGNTFLHIGISPTHPQNVIWDYYGDASSGRSTQV